MYHERRTVRDKNPYTYMNNLIKRSSKKDLTFDNLCP